MKINKKLDYNTELLVITMEECGELIEACSKAIRCEDYYNNPKLLEELGDVQCMIKLTCNKLSYLISELELIPFIKFITSGL